LSDPTKTIMGWLGKVFLILLTIFLTAFSNDIRTYFGISTQYHLLTLLIILVLIILTLVTIIHSIFAFIKKQQNKRTMPNEKHNNSTFIESTKEKPEIKYVKYDAFRWKVSVLNDKYNVAKSPICLICCIPIDFYQNEWDSITYKCAKCGTNYNENYNIPQIRKALILELKTHGFNRIKFIYDKPCKQ